MRSVLRSQCSQILPVTLLPASQKAERFIYNVNSLLIQENRYHHPTTTMYGVLCAYRAGCGWQVQYLLQSSAFGGMSLNVCTFTYISKDKTKAENICLM